MVVVVVGVVVAVGVWVAVVVGVVVGVAVGVGVAVAVAVGVGGREMTIDHDAIAAKVRCDLTLGLNMCAAYLDLYDEVQRLRATGEIDRKFARKTADDVVSWKSRAEEAEAERDRLRAALTIYAQSGNWRLGGCCDPNSPNFTGEAIARAALKGDSDE